MPEFSARTRFAALRIGSCALSMGATVEKPFTA
jgi:hypothetical protein